MSDFRIDQITNQAGTAGPDIAGITTFSGSSGLLMPSGPTEYRGGRGRGLFGGGYLFPALTYVNTIDYVTISTLGESKDFGDLYQTRGGNSAVSSSTRGIWGGGYTNAPGAVFNIIDYVTISTTGNSFDFGDLTTSKLFLSTCSSSTRGIFAGGGIGFAVVETITIEFISIASLGNSSNFGDISVSRKEFGGCSNSTRGVFGGGRTPTVVNTIDFVTMSTLGNAQDFGDLITNITNSVSFSNSVRGILSGGSSPSTPTSRENIIQFITIASLGDAIDFGDLTTERSSLSGCSSSTRGIAAGGFTPLSPLTVSNVIDFITIATTGDAQDFGDLTQARSAFNACSDAHGGLGD